MSARISVPPAMMERVEHIPTAAVRFISRLDVLADKRPYDVVGANALTFGGALVEALASSRIEGIDTSVAQAALAFLQPRHPYVTQAGRAVASAMHATFEAFNGHADYRDHRVSHTRLMRAQGTPQHGRGFRDSVVRVSDHVAPAPTRIPDLMDDLAAFVENRREIIVHAAIAHAQFETIHPYTDGNGRIGRALLSGHLGVPVSRHLARHRQRYYDALRDFRLGDATPIVELVSDAADDGFELVEQTNGYDRDDSDWLDGLSQRAQDAAHRIREVPLGEMRRMLRTSSELYVLGFHDLLRAGVITEASRSDEGYTVYAYLPAIREWISQSGTNLYATHHADSWKGDLSVHV